MIQDYISRTPLSSVELTDDFCYLNKNILEIRSLNDPEKVIGYQCLRLFIEQNFKRVEIEQNFDLLWKAYGVYDYQSDILTDSLDDVKEYWQAKNLEHFNLFLKEHPMLYTDGLYYGVEEVDRNEMNQQLGIYNAKVAAGLSPAGVQWHSKKKACKEMSIEDFLTLSAAIEQYTLPYYNLMQKRKEEIFECKDKESVLVVPITYTVESQEGSNANESES